ncbi:MAG: hypothetical protein HY831_05455, partial [Candidatus Aenigmarchaeota archaeon]|nr:hypothetical protein [Candidatus Aenigmarchaeota archaeon]
VYEKVPISAFTGKDGIDPWNFYCEKGKGRAYRDGDKLLYEAAKDSVVYLGANPNLDVSVGADIVIPMSIISQGVPNSTASNKDRAYPVRMDIVVATPQGNKFKATKCYTACDPATRDGVETITLGEITTLNFGFEKGQIGLLESISFSGSSVDTNGGFKVSVGPLYANLYR